MEESSKRNVFVFFLIFVCVKTSEGTFKHILIVSMFTTKFA